MARSTWPRGCRGGARGGRRRQSTKIVAASGGRGEAAVEDVEVAVVGLTHSASFAPSEGSVDEYEPPPPPPRPPPRTPTGLAPAAAPAPAREDDGRRARARLSALELVEALHTLASHPRLAQAPRQAFFGRGLAQVARSEVGRLQGDTVGARLGAGRSPPEPPPETPPETPPRPERSSASPLDRRCRRRRIGRVAAPSPSAGRRGRGGPRRWRIGAAAAPVHRGGGDQGDAARCAGPSSQSAGAGSSSRRIAATTR